MKAKIIGLTLFFLILFGCGHKAELQLPSDPWEYLKACSCDSATYCLTDEDYIRIILYNEALKSQFR